MEALVNLLAKYFGIDPAVLFAAMGLQQSGYDSSPSKNDESNEYANGVHLDDNDGNHDDSNEYVDGVLVGDSDHDESNEYANGMYVGDNDRDHDDANEYANGGYMGTGSVRTSAGYSEISDDRNDQYRFELKGSELADGDLVDAGEQIVAKYELGRRGWEFDRLDSDESLSVQVYNNEAFIVETEYERPGKVEFKIFSDLDGDQVWTEVVEGEVYSSSTSIDLVGLVNAGVIDPAMLLG